MAFFLSIAYAPHILLDKRIHLPFIVFYSIYIYYIEFFNFYIGLKSYTYIISKKKKIAKKGQKSQNYA